MQERPLAVSTHAELLNQGYWLHSQLKVVSTLINHFLATKERKYYTRGTHPDFSKYS